MTTGVRVPDALWLPTPIASDGFGSAFGTTDGLGHAEGIAGGIGAGGSGMTWSNVGGTWSVSGGKAINTPVGVEQITNGNFSAWTGDNPNGWTTDFGEDANNYITQNPAGQCQIVRTNKTMGIRQGSSVIGKWYLGSIDVKAVASGSLAFWNYNGGAIFLWGTSTTGIKTATIRATQTGGFQVFLLDNPSNITIDDFSVRVLDLNELISLSNLSCADVLAKVEIYGSSYAGLALNWDSSTTPANGVVVFLAGSNIIVDKYAGGALSNVSKTAYTYSAGATLTVAKSGTGYRVYYNNAFIVAVTISDAGIISNTLHGLFSTGTSNTLDNFVCYATGTGGEYSYLDTFTGV